MRTLWRALLSFGPIAVVAFGFVAVSEYSTEFRGPTRSPDLGLLRGETSPFEAHVGHVSVRGTGGSDLIEVARAGDGVLAVTINGRRREYAVDAARRLQVRGRGGDDVIRAEAGVSQELALSGGEGDDVLVGAAGDDVISGGPGDDTIRARGGDDLVDAGPGDDDIRMGDGRDGADGGGGADRIEGNDGGDYLQGGPGRDTLLGLGGADVLYGLDGGDLLTGGAGADYIDGGAGRDVARGGAGTDIVFGGAGADVLDDTAGGDLLFGGPGRDARRAGARSHLARKPDAVPDLAGTVAVVGDAAFAARVRSDLDALLSMPLGRDLLRALAASGMTVELRATDEGNSISFAAPAAARPRDGGGPGPGSDSTVHYNPYRTTVGDGGRAWQRRPPIVGLVHELIHALHGAHGVLEWDDEAMQRQAIGDSAEGGARTAAPDEAGSAEGATQLFTENSFRAALGLPSRERR